MDDEAADGAPPLDRRMLAGAAGATLVACAGLFVVPAVAGALSLSSTVALATLAVVELGAALAAVYFVMNVHADDGGPV